MATEPEFRIYSTESLGAAIRHFRKQAGLTQNQLAELAHIQRTYLTELEQGRHADQTRRLIIILKHLGIRMTLQKADW